ncbi:DUF6088 family protein [Reichenbachiella agariperforans]|uniref:DUF6088 family protein n=1 Tax=Reichenbachiella agariperforans TaxID=156994 RepID=UPI00338F45A9
MKISEYIAESINRLPKGYVFTYDDFIQSVNNKEAIIKALNRMVTSGKINKLSKGKYYKPEKTPFGDLAPDQYQVVKDILEDNGKLIGYLTGYSIFNKLGLTTQVSNTIQIGKNETRPRHTRDRYTITYLRQKNIINKVNVPLLQLLDAIYLIKKIPDTTIASACERLLKLINNLTQEEESAIIRLSQKYSPATRALLGAILEELDRKNNLATLQKSLNPITKYELPGAKKTLSTTSNWNIE